MNAVVMLVGIVARQIGHDRFVKPDRNLASLIDVIPSKYLSKIDTEMLHSIPPARGESELFFHVPSLLNGLIFVRVVEVSRPNLTVRAHAFRSDALATLEPIFENAKELADSVLGQEAGNVAEHVAFENLVVAAVNSVGKKIHSDASDNNKFCVSALIAITQSVCEMNEYRLTALIGPQRKAASLLVFLMASHLTAKCRADFEVVVYAVIAGLLARSLSPDAALALTDKIGATFNSRPPAIGATEALFVKWLTDPSKVNFCEFCDELICLEKLCFPN